MPERMSGIFAVRALNRHDVTRRYINKRRTSRRHTHPPKHVVYPLSAGCPQPLSAVMRFSILRISLFGPPTINLLT
jgi:hypothetical protein